MIFNVSKEDRYKCGIYKIHSIFDNRVYIGCTENFNIRFNVHNSNVRTGKHYNKDFVMLEQNKGNEALIFSIIEICSISELNSREMHHILKNKSCDPKYGFNRVMPLDTVKYIRTRY